MTDKQFHYRTCHLCETMCGIEVEHDGEKILAIRGDKKDVLSQGNICPKATGQTEQARRWRGVTGDRKSMLICTKGVPVPRSSSI